MSSPKVRVKETGVRVRPYQREGAVDWKAELEAEKAELEGNDCEEWPNDEPLVA